MNLLNTSWIPVRRQSGERDYIAPYQITSLSEANPIVAIDAPRPDFSAALMQFLIGLVQVAAAPNDDSDWVKLLENPPSEASLQEKFNRYEAAFNLDGDGPRFMQDFSALEGQSLESIAALLIDVPAAQTQKDNKDHFVKRGSVNALCPSCAATALFTLQTNAPAGGAGHLTSLRGGGPLTTLVVLDPEGSGLKPTLWRNIWLNIVLTEKYSALTGDDCLQQDKDIFPWLAPTRCGGKQGKDTFPHQVHPLGVAQK